MMTGCYPPRIGFDDFDTIAGFCNNFDILLALEQQTQTIKQDAMVIR